GLIGPCRLLFGQNKPSIPGVKLPNLPGFSGGLQNIARMDGAAFGFAARGFPGRRNRSVFGSFGFGWRGGFACRGEQHQDDPDAYGQADKTDIRHTLGLDSLYETRDLWAGLIGSALHGGSRIPHTAKFQRENRESGTDEQQA